MKFIALIFSIYMTLLAVLPCRDTDDFGNMGKINASITQSHSEDSKAGKETCTPFCTCACCSTVRTITPQQPISTLFVQPVIKTYSEAPVPAILEQSISVWQPPQIG